MNDSWNKILDSTMQVQRKFKLSLESSTLYNFTFYYEQYEVIKYAESKVN